MPVAILQIPLTVQPTSGGEAELLPPDALRNLNYEFHLVKEGGTEGIIRLEAPEATLREVLQNGSCKALEPEEVEELML